MEQQLSKPGAKAPPPQPWHLLGLRGYMAFAVVFLHSVDGLPQKDIGNIFRYEAKARLHCHRGVVVFFMLSSFQLTYNLLWTVPPQNAGWMASLKVWGRYLLRRVFRIYPNYVAMLLFIKAFPKYYNGARDDFSLWRQLTFQEAFGVFWTLPAEVEYYFVIPLLVLAYKEGELADYGSLYGHASASLHLPFRAFHWRFRMLALLPFASLALYLSQTRSMNEMWVPYCHLPPYFPIFFLGSLVGILLYNMQLSETSRGHGGNAKPDAALGPLLPARLTLLSSSLLKNPAVASFCELLQAGLVWALFCIFSDLFSLLSWYNKEGAIELAIERPSDTVYVAASLALIFLSSAFPVTFPGSWNHVMTSKSLLWAGKISYALYLSHPVVTKLAQLYLPEDYPNVLTIVYIGAVLLAMFIQRVIEVPGAKVGDLLIRQLGKFLDWQEEKRQHLEADSV